VASAVALTSVAQASAMALGGVLAVLIAARFGGDARTDGFFAAYAAYGFVVLVGQSTRLTYVQRLVADRFAAFNTGLGALGVLWGATGVVFVAAGAPVSALLTGNPTAEDHAREALAILWPAAGAQLFASLAAAMLGVLEDYVRAAIAYLVGGLTTIAGFLALAGPLDVTAVPVAVLAGSLVTAAPLGWALSRRGWRLGRPRAVSGAAARAARMVLGAASVAVPQLLYVISMVFAARLGEGEPTVYSYAFFGTGLLVAVVASSVSIVLAAPVAEGWDGDPESLRTPVEETFRTGLLVLCPVLGVAALAGDELAAPLLAGFSDAEVDLTMTTLLAFGPSVVAAMLIAIPLIALYARERAGAIAALAPPVLALHVVVSAIAVAIDGLEVLALAASTSTLVFAALVLRLFHGRGWIVAARRLVAETATVGGGCAAIFGAAAAAASPGPAAALAGVIVFSALVLAVPRYSGLVHRLVGRGRRQPASARS
jgi:peptidoglycan biosynthesis protein MviN/MurJ (putative lipid II flippase)